MNSIETQTQFTLDPEDKQKRIQHLMEYTKEEIATQWVTFVYQNFFFNATIRGIDNGASTIQ